MAQKVTITMVDDIDGTVGDDVATTEFGVGGERLEIDLSPANRAKLDAGLAKYIAAARKVTGRKAGGKRATATAKSATRPAVAADRARNQEIREWAEKHGKVVKSRGRLPRTVLAAWEAKQPELLSA